MTTYESPDATQTQPSSPARPRRLRLSRAERGAVLIAAAAVAGFTGYGFATHSPSTVGYVSSVLVIAAAVVGLRRVVLPPLLAAGLAIAAIATLAGGLVRVGHDVLYNANTGLYSPSLGTHFLQYDHFAHAYCSFVIVFACWVTGCSSGSCSAWAWAGSPRSPPGRWPGSVDREPRRHASNRPSWQSHRGAARERSPGRRPRTGLAGQDRRSRSPAGTAQPSVLPWVSGPGDGVPGHAALYGIVPELTDIPGRPLS